MIPTAISLRLWASWLTTHGKGKFSSVPHCWQLALDETAVYYFPSQQRMQQATGNVRNMYITYSDEKRMITRSAVTDPDINIFLFQLLWEGTTDKPEGPSGLPPEDESCCGASYQLPHRTQPRDPQIPPYPVPRLQLLRQLLDRKFC